MQIYNFHEFFEKILMAVLKSCVKEHVYIIELRHIFGFVFNEKHEPIGVEEEMKIFDKVVKEMQSHVPEFRLKLGVCGLKIMPGHVPTSIENIQKALSSEYKHYISAFDMVNEEDTTPPISEFSKDLEEAKAANSSFRCCFHAGESMASDNDNLYDAFLIGSLRIGHGFNISLHPVLVQKAIEEKICLEVCPISNFILGYTLDL